MLILLYLLASVAGQQATQETTGVLGCSGYVRSDFSVDFSQINVGLFTEHGSQRDTTDCAPSNGYFFLPVEQHGNYILKVLPPPGWTVSPPEMVIHVDGRDDVCSKNQDIIFHFSGFSIFGQISSKDKEAGPTGLSLTLYKKGSKDLIATVFSDEAGNFEFRGLRPDSYTVGLSADSLESFSFEKREQEVRVELGSVTLSPFVIIGYDVEGMVADVKGNPIAGVGLHLLTSGAEAKSAISDQDGKYRFSNVSRGAYEVKPSKANVDIVLTPETLQATVFDKNVVVDKFLVREFILRGKVLSDKETGTPLAGATVTGKQDGHLHSATTSATGDFSLNAAIRGEMIVSCHRDGLEFDDVVVQVTPSGKLPPLVPSKYRVAGTVETGDSSGSVTVSFTKTARGEVVAKSTVNGGSFQAHLPRGKYLVTVSTADSNDAENYLPKEAAVEVKDKPQEGLAFLLARFSVSGSVKCFDSSVCDDAVVILSSNSGFQPVTRSVVKNSFTFTDVRQGQYVVSIRDDSRCWASMEHQLNVKSDTKDLKFEQRGFHMDVSTDHDTKLVLKDPKGKVRHTFDLVKGQKKICVEGSERLTVTTEGCYGFKSTPEILSLGKDHSLNLATISYKIMGQVVTANEIPDLQVTASSDKRKNEALKLTRNVKGYQFQLDAETTESLALTPSSKNTFFEPTVILVQVKDSCHENAVEFLGREGVFVQGHLSPPVVGALVQVMLPDGTVTAYSENDGSFKIGPFVDESPKKIEVTKEGYFFEATDSYGRFNSKQLSSITIAVKDEQGRALPEDAVIAISGGDSFKNSVHTKDGSVKFGTLHPGEYFIKAFLKEWVFKPKNIIVKLQENKDETRDLVARRVAYSAMGEVIYLNGNRAGGVVVLGRTKMGHGQKGVDCTDKVEDSMTSADGVFRLRGLEPHCSYDIESGNKDIQLLITKNKTVQVVSDDLRLPARIIAHGKAESFHLSINVKTKNPSKRKTVTVKISTENDVVPAKLFNLAPNQLTLLPPLPVIDEEYVVKFDGKIVKRISRQNVAFQYFILDLNEEESKLSRRESGSKFYYLVPLSMLFLAAAAFRRYYKQKE